MAKKVFTLFVGDDDIKVLLTNNEKIEKWGTIPVEPGTIVGGVVVNVDQVGLLLERQLNTMGIKAKRVILAMSSPEALFRLVTMPRLPDKVLPEAVRREAEKAMPVSLDDFYLSYQVMPKSSDEINVLMAIYPKDATDNLLMMARKAGLVPYLMDLAPIALCRMIVEPKAVLLNNQANNLDIAVISDRLPQVIRSLSIPGGISSSLRFDTIHEEMERTISFYNSSHPDSLIDTNVPVFACGDLLESPDSAQVLSQKLGYTVSSPPVPLIIPPAFDSIRYMINIALATKSLIPELSQLNFNALPAGFRPKGVSVVNIAVGVGLAAGAGVFLVLTPLYMDGGTNLQSLNSRLDTIHARGNVQQTQIASVYASINQTEDAIAAVDAKTNALAPKVSALADSRTGASADLIEIRRLLPPGVQVKSISFGDIDITVSGYASNEGDVYVYATRLGESDLFTLSTISSIMRKASGNNSSTYDFELLVK